METLKARKSVKEVLRDIWIQFLAEVLGPLLPDRTTYMRFTRQLRFHGKVKTLTKAAFSK